MSRWNAKIKASGSEITPELPISRAVKNPQMHNEPLGFNDSLSASDTIKAAIDRAQQLVKQNYLDEAHKAYEDILDKRPETAIAYVGIGNIHAMRGEYDDAVEYYTGALHIRKDFPIALVMLGNVYVKQGLLDKAVDNYKRALHINPGLSIAELNIARVYLQSDKYDAALQHINEALKYNPQLEEARLMRASAYQRMHDIKSALSELSSMVERETNSLQVYTEYARLLLQTDAPQQAAEVCGKALQMQPDNAILSCLLGKAYIKLNEYELALSAYSKALEVSPDLPIARIGVVRARLGLGHLSEAKKILIDMTKQQQNLGLVHKLLGDVFMEEHAYSDAIQEFQAALMHSKKLTELHPHLLEIKGADTANYEELARAYQRAFAEIETDSVLPTWRGENTGSMH